MDHPRGFPPISILIAAYNEEQNLPETLISVANQDYPAPVEIIVADDGSTDETISVLKALRMPNLSVLQVEHGGKARGSYGRAQGGDPRHHGPHRCGHDSSTAGIEADCRAAA